MSQIDYYILNLSFSMSDNDKKKYLSQHLKTLVERDITYFDLISLQTIIDYKWTTYTRGYFLKQFYILLVFSAAFVADLWTFKVPSADEKTYDEMDEKLEMV